MGGDNHPYKDHLHVHIPRIPTIAAKAIGAVATFWFLYRLKQDGAKTFGWKYSFDGTHLQRQADEIMLEHYEKQIEKGVPIRATLFSKKQNPGNLPIDFDPKYFEEKEQKK